MLLTLLGMIPGLLSLIEKFQSSYFDSKVKIYQAKTGADRDVAVEALQSAEKEAHERTTALSIIASSKILTIMVVAFAFPLIAFEWWVILHDKIWCIGRHCLDTDPITGAVGDWASTIIVSIFGSSTSMALGKMWLSREK